MFDVLPPEKKSVYVFELLRALGKGKKVNHLQSNYFTSNDYLIRICNSFYFFVIWN